MSTRDEQTNAPLTNPENWLANYGDFLFRYAWHRVQKRDVAEDLVQETFLAALRSRESFQARSSEKTWLLGIMKHKIIDYMRKSARERSTVQEISLDDVPENLFDQAGEWAVKPSRWDTDPWKVLEKKEFRDTLMGCLAELPSRMAHVFALREIEQLEGEEVSRVMEVSSNNLGVLLHRARHRLRLCLEINWFA